MALDEKTHNIYLATASFGPPQANSTGGRQRPTILPDTFKIVIVGSAANR